MKKLYIETYGCQMNVADSEVVASVMKMAGYDVCENEDEADAIFLNTCSIRENAENKIYNRLETLYAEKRKGREVILGVLGCMAERVRKDLIENHHANFGLRTRLVSELARDDSTLREWTQRNGRRPFYHRNLPRHRATAHRRQSCIGLVSIMRGCNNFCHYCIVPTPAVANAAAMCRASSTSVSTSKSAASRK